MPMAAKAVHNEGLFELDGNIAADAAAPGQDWSNFRDPATADDTAPLSTVFIADKFNSADDIFFGGGSQNNNDMTSWRWSCGSVSTKSDIEHAFATAYIKNDQLHIYFGGDRYDPTGGTTNIGFWFLQGGGALQGGNGCPDLDPAINRFSGQHVDGDLFVFAEFNGGGGDSAVSMYEWQNGGLSLLAAKSALSFCSVDDNICAQTNDATIASTWPYSDNQGSSPDGQILPGGFVEGGINLSSIYAGPRQGASVRQPLPRPDGQLPSGHRRARGLRGRLVQRLLEADRRQGHAQRRPDEVPVQRERPGQLLRLVRARLGGHPARQRADQARHLHGDGDARRTRACGTRPR